MIIAPAPPSTPITDYKTHLIETFDQAQATVGVIGLGYVGLPMALAQAKAGFKVVGIDNNPDRVCQVLAGESYIADVTSETLRRYVEQQSLVATSDYAVIQELDAVIICVPTPLTKNREPDISYIQSVCKALKEHLRPGQLVSLESTTFPGTTEEVVLPILSESGLTVGEDFFLVFSPERVDPGNPHFDTYNTSKLIGGITPACNQVGMALYRRSIKTMVPVSNARTAEITKVFENTFRGINIAVVNELAQLCDRLNINVWEVIDAASTKPFGFMPFYPGPGVGGNCIPVDPFYLSWKAREFNFTTRFIELAGEINNNMPYFVREKLNRTLGRHYKSLNGSRVLVLGVGYKKDQGDWRDAPSQIVFDILSQDGVNLVYHDPFAPDFQDKAGRCYESTPLSKALLEQVDCVLILTAHSNVDYQLVADWAPLIVDTRNALKQVKVPPHKLELL